MMKNIINKAVEVQFNVVLFLSAVIFKASVKTVFRFHSAYNKRKKINVIVIHPAAFDFFDEDLVAIDIFEKVTKQHQDMVLSSNDCSNGRLSMINNQMYKVS